MKLTMNTEQWAFTLGFLVGGLFGIFLMTIR